jgi:hypothetical protein
VSAGFARAGGCDHALPLGTDRSDLIADALFAAEQGVAAVLDRDQLRLGMRAAACRAFSKADIGSSTALMTTVGTRICSSGNCWTAGLET